MRKRNISKLIVCMLLLCACTLIGCSDIDYSNPKQVVIAMFGAMEKNDQAALAHILDLKALMKIDNEDYALQSNNPRTFTSPLDILNDLTDDGVTKTRWFSYQRIINKEAIIDETATVEVTFVDQDNSKGYLVKFGLHLINGKWKIYSFNTIQASQGTNN